MSIGDHMPLFTSRLARFIARFADDAYTSNEALRDGLSMNPPMIGGYLSWARASGLLSDRKVTPLADMLLRRDPSFETGQAQGALWAEIVFGGRTQYLRGFCDSFASWPIGVTRSGDALTEFACRASGADPTQRRVFAAARDEVKQALNALSKDDALGKLRITRRAGGRWERGLGQAPAAAVGYTLARFWEDSTTHTPISAASRLLRLFSLGEETLLDRLRSLERLELLMVRADQRYSEVQLVGIDPLNVLGRSERALDVLERAWDR